MLSRFVPSRLHFLFLLILITSSIQAQLPNTIISGSIAGAGPIKSIDLDVNQKYLDNTHEQFTSNILEDGTFAFSFTVNEPQFVTIEFARNRALVYVEPYDSIQIAADAKNFQYDLFFTGKGGGNNNFLYEYLKENPTELNQFNLSQYHYGKFWYSCSPAAEKKMGQLYPDNYSKDLLMLKEKYRQMLEFHVANNPGKLSNDFISYIETEITYNFGYHMFLYGHIYRNKYKTPETFFSFIEDIPIQSKHIGNYWYREYLKAYFNHKMMKAEVPENYFALLYDFAGEALHSKALAYYQSEIVSLALRKKKYDMISAKYYSFLKTNPYIAFEEKVMSHYSISKRFAEGTYAPDFTVKDIEGNDVILSNYKGKVVFLNFWASWCKPCMKKMIEIQPYLNELQQDGVVFLNVTLDEKEDVLNGILENKKFKGTHIMAKGSIESDITRSYEVKVLPQYFIIRKDGSFAEKPEKYNVVDIKERLKALANK